MKSYRSMKKPICNTALLHRYFPTKDFSSDSSQSRDSSISKGSFTHLNLWQRVKWLARLLFAKCFIWERGERNVHLPCVDRCTRIFFRDKIACGKKRKQESLECLLFYFIFGHKFIESFLVKQKLWKL